MIEWLLAPIDTARLHDLSAAVAWHGRLMVLAWAFVFPTGIVVARFFKITPRQKWPQQLDSKVWWYTHLTTQYAGALLTGVAVFLIWQVTRDHAQSSHAVLGWVLVSAALCQLAGGWLRGSKGGPTAPALDGSLAGDHYNMTRRRRVFEHAHKTVGYASFVVSVAAIVTGLWYVNAPRWMFVLCGAWWAALVAVWCLLQRRGLAIDTYQAIWGVDRIHPGNLTATPGWGTRRRDPEAERNATKRQDRS